MQVSFNPSVSFRQQAASVEQPKEVVTVPTVPVQLPEPKKKTGFIEGISNIAKTFATLGEMTKASIKAVGYGSATAAVGLASFWTFSSFPKSFKSLESFKDVVKHPLKNISKTGKIVSGLLGVGVAAFHIIKGILATNQKTANVDHQLKTGHRDA